MRTSRWFSKTMSKLLDLLLNFLAIYLGYVVLIVAEPSFPVSTSTVLPVAVLISLITSFLYASHGVYEPMRTHRAYYFATRIFFVHLEILGFALLFVLLLHKENNRDYILWIAVAWSFSTIFIISKKATMIRILHSIRSNQKDNKYILLLTDSQDMADSYLEEVGNNPQFGYCVIGYVGNVSIAGLPHLGTTGELDRILKEYRPDEVVMAFDTVRKKVITKYVSVCNDNCCKVFFIPTICGYFRAPRQVVQMGNLPMVDIRSTPLDNVTNQMIKRFSDIVISAFLILLTAPLMAAVAIGVKISSPGPILFCQKRVGKNNEEFTMYKFRSMRVNDKEETGWSSEGDDRKTVFGAFIRKFALDELPQFFNVFKGDMSLVGPRPEVPFYVEKFKKEIPLYMLKHTLRPGITGLAQIKGLRGDTSIRKRIEEDINYIENWSIFEDVRILLLTPFHTVNRHEKYVAPGWLSDEPSVNSKRERDSGDEENA